MSSAKMADSAQAAYSRMFQRSMSTPKLATRAEALGDDVPVFRVREPDDEYEIPDYQDRHDEEGGPIERIVEAGRDDVVGGGRIGDAEGGPLLLFGRVLVQRFPGRVGDRIGRLRGAGETHVERHV